MLRCYNSMFKKGGKDIKRKEKKKEKEKETEYFSQASGHSQGERVDEGMG